MSNRLLPNIIRAKEVRARTGLTHSHIYKLMGKGTFPRCIKLADKAVGWREDEVDAWLAGRLKEHVGKRGPGRPPKNRWLAPAA